MEINELEEECEKAEVDRDDILEQIEVPLICVEPLMALMKEPALVSQYCDDPHLIDLLAQDVLHKWINEMRIKVPSSDNLGATTTGIGPPWAAEPRAFLASGSAAVAV